MHKFLIILLFVHASNLQAQDVKVIKLQKQNSVLRLEHYHVTSISDGRKDPSTIGYMQNGKGKRTPLNLFRNAATSISEFIITNSIQADISSATELRITELEAITKPAGSGEQLALNMSLAFLINKKQLIEYKVKATDYAPEGQDITETIAKLISKNLVDRLQEFDGWWAKKQSSTVVFDSVKVEAVLENRTDIPNMIIYSGNRPLNLDDFTGKPDTNSRGDAATFSGMIANYDTRNENGRLIIIAHITAYFDKGKSWCRLNSRNSRTLEHEQHHFDITAIKACELVQELNKHTFSLSNYNNELEKLFQQKQQEENELQNKYDIQAGHGRIIEMQEEWNVRIKKELKNIPCFR